MTKGGWQSCSNKHRDQYRKENVAKNVSDIFFGSHNVYIRTDIVHKTAALRTQSVIAACKIHFSTRRRHSCHHRRSCSFQRRFSFTFRDTAANPRPGAAVAATSTLDIEESEGRREQTSVANSVNATERITKAE